MSGLVRSSRQSATRRRSPPESVFTAWSGGGQRRASIAISSWLSMVQASIRSSFSWTSACLLISLSICSGVMSSPNFALISSYSLSSAKVSFAPSRTTSMTVRVSSIRGSCSRYPIE